MDLKQILAHLQGGQFRLTFGERLRLDTLGHFVCEARQWTVAGMTDESVDTFLKQICSDVTDISSEEKMSMCREVAAYALQ